MLLCITPCYSALLRVTLHYSVLLYVTPQELQHQLQRLTSEKARLEERMRDLEAEKSNLEVYFYMLHHMTVTLAT